MTDKIVSLAAKRPGNKEAADYFREVADRLERGEITDIVVAFNDAENYCYERYGDWSDRWRIYGAIDHE